MKSYDESVRSLLARRDAYRRKRKKTVAAVAGGALLMCCGLGVWLGSGKTYPGWMTPWRTGQVQRWEAAVPEKGGQVVRLAVNVPKDQAAVELDMDVQYVAEEDARLTFGEDLGMALSDFLERIPEKYRQTQQFYGLSTPWVTDSGEREYRLHDYVLEFRGEGEQRIQVAMCPQEAPLRDCFLHTETPELSEVCGVPMTVYGLRDSYTAWFVWNGVYYDVETYDLDLEALGELLAGLLAPNLERAMVISCYEAETGSASYRTPENGEWYCFPDVEAARRAYAGENVVFLLTVDVFTDGDQISGSGLEAEYRRLSDQGYAFYQLPGGEAEESRVLLPLTEEALQSFQPPKDRGYAFRFSENLGWDREDLIAAFPSYAE